MDAFIFSGRRNGKDMDTTEPKTFYGKVIKRVEECIWEYLDTLNFDCDGVEVELETNIKERNIDVKIKDKDGNIYSYLLDPSAPYFDPCFSARLITEQFISACSRRLELTNKLKWQAFSNDIPVYYHDAALSFSNMTNYINNKEDNKMAKFTMGTMGVCEGFYTDAPTPKTAEQVEYEQKLLTLQRTLEDEVKAAKDKYAMAVDALNKERSDAKRIAEEDKAARNRKDRYDALVRAGFTEEQAWKMLMQDLGA